MPKRLKSASHWTPTPRANPRAKESPRLKPTRILNRYLYTATAQTLNLWTTSQFRAPLLPFTPPLRLEFRHGSKLKHGGIDEPARPRHPYSPTLRHFQRLRRGVAKALQNGDTYLTAMIGVSIAKRVWPEDSPEWKAAAEQRRVYDYRSKLYQKLEQRALTHPGEYLTLCEQNRRESDLFAAQLTAAGYDPNPSAQP